MSDFIKVTLVSRPDHTGYLNFDLVTSMSRCADGKSTHLWSQPDYEYSVVETPEELIQRVRANKRHDNAVA